VSDCLHSSIFENVTLPTDRSGIHVLREGHISLEKIIVPLILISEPLLVLPALSTPKTSTLSGLLSKLDGKDSSLATSPEKEKYSSFRSLVRII
jgi:hypothetical protein